VGGVCAYVAGHLVIFLNSKHTNYLAQSEANSRAVRSSFAM
jgi:hypothetical protein